MIIVVLTTFFLSCLGNSPWDPRTGLMDERENGQEMAESQGEPVAEEKPDLPNEKDEE